MHVVAILTVEMLKKLRFYTLGLCPCFSPRLVASTLQFRLNLVPEGLRTVDIVLPCSLTKNLFCDFRSRTHKFSFWPYKFACPPCCYYWL